MADAKKSTKPAAAKSGKAPAAKVTGPAKPTDKKAKKPAAAAAASAGMPMIDTSSAAAAAAKMIGHKLGGDKSAGGSGPARTESASFRQLKESLNKPAGQGAASFIQSTAPAKKSSSPFGGGNQVRHNQTFGADVNRTGVPRRTGGG